MEYTQSLRILHAGVKTIHRSYRFALYPTKSQEVLLNQQLGCVRFVYNYFLNQRMAQYRETGRSANY
jgi:putative transposase